MSLWIDRYGRIHNYLRISLTDRCNLRCSYCMPAGKAYGQARDNLLTSDEIVRVVSIMARHGVNKVRFTGGEPTLRSDLADLVYRCSGISGIQTVALTTNGVRFADLASELQVAGLSSVNISLDSLDPDTFAQIAGRNELPRVLRSIETALQLGFRPLKLNTVIMRGVNDGELLDFVEWTRDLPLNVRFIEYMPFRGNEWDPQGVLTYSEIREQIETRYHLLPLSENGVPHRIAEEFSVPGHQGTVSIIASMTRSFCDSCSRLRLTAGGSLKACLFFPATVSLREALRTGANDIEIERIIQESLNRKPAGHPGPMALHQLNDLSMVEIGG